ncbi:hypothetical protein KR044_006723 [Drosophila immigrans]|nr:hypothetical protein KR044_006723 [Drosophila immigrans]
MYQPVALFIGLRYMRGRASDRFGRFVSWLSTIGITLGVMALVTVLSVMNGFEKDLENNILGLMPQALVTSPQGSVNPQQLPASEVQKLQGVTRVAPLTTGDVVLQSARSVAVGVMLGVNPDEADPLTPYLVNVKQQQLQPGQYNIIIGEQLAGQLGVKRGDSLRVMVPSASQFTPMGRIPSQRLFTLIGTFHANSEVDGYQLLVNQQDASRLMRYPAGNITGWRLFLQQPLAVDTLSQQALPAGTVWKDWRDRKGELFQAVRMEKNMMGLLLSLIVAVAAFNIITSLGLLVMEKQGEVAILQTQGLTRRQIMSVFMVQGASAGIIGSLLGTLLGVLLATNLNNLMPILGALIDGASLPVAVDPLQVTIIAVVAMACDNLCKTYQEGNLHTDVLRNVSFAMQQGEMMAIVGSSGSGKSTLLHLLGGLDSPTSGEVIFKGESLNAMSSAAKAELRNRQLGFIYQFHHLLPDFTALENAAMPLLIGGAKPAQAQEKAREMLAAVGLEKRSKHRPSELSGGERQRVAIARALVNNPALVLADEPTGNLDKRTADSIFDLLGELNVRQGTAFLVVTHDLQLAKRLSRQLEMADGHLQAQLTLMGAE